MALKGFNEDELFPLIEWCKSRDMDITFIEVMPMGDIGNEDRLDQYWKLTDLRARLATNTRCAIWPNAPAARPAMSNWRRPVRRSASSPR